MTRGIEQKVQTSVSGLPLVFTLKWLLVCFLICQVHKLGGRFPGVHFLLHVITYMLHVFFYMQPVSELFLNKWQECG